MAGLSMLVVEDDVRLQKAFVLILRTQGHEVAGAAGGAEALSRLEGRPFDIVLLDLGLPDVRELDLLAAVRARWPQTAVVVASGRSDARTAVQALTLGAVDYLTKPVEADGLVRVIEAAAARPKNETAGATLSLAERSGRAERDAIVEALRAHGGDRDKVAQVLGVSRRTLYRRLKEFGLLDR